MKAPKPPSRKKIIIYTYLFLKKLLVKYKSILIGIIIIFILGFLTAFIIPNDLKASTLTSTFDEFSKFGTEETSLFYSILLNNLRVTVMNFFLGFSVIIPLGIIFYNGFLIGLFSDFLFRISSINLTSQPLSLLLLSLLPHGIIEITALIFSTFLSVLMGLKMIFNKKIEPDLSRIGFVKEIIKVYLYVFIPLIFLAAIIESFVSYPLAQAFVLSQIKEDNTLNNIILTPNDFKKIQIKAQEEDSNNLIKSKDSLLSETQIIDYIYDEKIYQSLKEAIKPKHTINKIYKLNNNSMLSIQIQKFESEKEAIEYDTSTVKAIYLLAQKNKNFAIKNLGNNLYKESYLSNKVYLKYGRINNYTFLITYKGDNLELLDKIFSLQFKKISQL